MLSVLRTGFVLILLLALIACRRIEPVVTIGDRGGVQGGGFTMSVSQQFGRAGLYAFYARVTSESTRDALSEFTCGDPVPPMPYEMRLRPAGESNERLISVGYAPDLDTSFKDRCLYSGIDYVFPHHEWVAYSEEAADALTR